MVTRDLFLFFLAVAANYIGRLFNCGLQNTFVNNTYMKHVMGFMVLYYSIILSSADKTKHPLYVIALTWLLYAIFIVFTRCESNWALSALALIFASLVVDHFKKYYEEHGKPVKHLSTVITALQATAAVLIIFGFFVYSGKKSNEISPGDWSWFKFMFGPGNCKFDGVKGKNKASLAYALDGARRMAGLGPVS